MAPFSSFLTELIYGNLRHLVAKQKLGVTESVYFLLTQEPKKDLIDIKIENAVSGMQVMIEIVCVPRNLRIFK